MLDDGDEGPGRIGMTRVGPRPQRLEEGHGLAPADQTTSSPRVSLMNGVTRVAYDRCIGGGDVCLNTRVLYRRSLNGTDYGPAERVSPTGMYEAFAGGVAFAEDVVVVYTGYSPDGAFARRGS